MANTSPPIPGLSVVDRNEPEAASLLPINRRHSALRTRGGRLLTGIMNGTPASTPAGSTWHATVASPAPFTAIAPLFMNQETGTIAIGSCAVAAVESLADYPHSSATWVPVLFSGSASGTMPARVAASQPSLYAGDLTKLTSVPSTDGSGMYYAAMRAYFPGTSYSYLGLAVPISSVSLAFGGQIWRSSSQNVDGVSTPSAFTQNNESNNLMFIGFITRNEVDELTVMFCGDSTQRGTGSVTGVDGPGVRAVAALSTRALPVTAFNAGSPSQVPAVYQANALRYLPVLKPSIAVYRISSINEAVTTQAIADNHFVLAMEFVEACRNNSVIPILETCTPQYRGSAGDLALRSALNDRVRAYCKANRIACSDIAAIVEDPANRDQYIAAYSNNDNSHMNPLGNQAASAAVVQAIREALVL